MILKKIIEFNKYEFGNLLEQLYDKSVEYEDYDNIYKLNYYLEHFEDIYMNENFNILLNDDNRFADFLNISNFNNKKIIKPFFLVEESKEIYNFLKDNYPKDILMLSKFNESHKYGINPLKYESSFNNNNYRFNDSNKYYTYEGDIYFIRDYIESKFLKEIDLSKTTYLNIDENTLTNLLSENNKDEFLGNLSWVDNNNHNTALGFRYLHTNNTTNKNMLVAINDNTILGVIKYGMYGEQTSKRQSMVYIDVNEKYWRQGIATNLIKELDKHIDKNHPLLITQESEMGQKVHTTDMFKKNIKNTKVIGWEEQVSYNIEI